MRNPKVPSHQIDVVEIMKKIRQSAGRSRADTDREDRVRLEAKGHFQSLLQNAKIPDYLSEQIRQQTLFEPYDPRTLFYSARPGLGKLIGFIRLILKPITKLFVNLDPLAGEVHRLSQMNNLYLRTVQEMIEKTAALEIEVHNLKKRGGHHRHRDERPAHQGQHHRRRNRNGRRNHNNRSSRPHQNAPAEPSTQ